MNPIRIFQGSFGGPTLYQNPSYVSPNEVCPLVLFQMCGYFGTAGIEFYSKTPSLQCLFCDILEEFCVHSNDIFFQQRRALMRKVKGTKYINKIHAKKGKEERQPEETYKVDPTDEVFKTH